MNRRDFITTSAIGSVGLLLPSTVLPHNETPTPHNQVKYIQNSVVLVNESPANPEGAVDVGKRLGESLPPEWKFLGITEKSTLLVYEDQVITTELDVVRLDMKLAGERINPENIKQVMFVIRSKHDPKKEWHLLGANAEVTWLQSTYHSGLEFDDRTSLYRVVFKPFKIMGVAGKHFFTSTVWP